MEKPNISCQSAFGKYRNRIFSPAGSGPDWTLPRPLDTLAPRTEAVQVRIPTAKSGISLGPFVELMARSGEGADPASFKWALKTGHFYRFIRTFRTSWVLLGAQCEALAHHSLHQNPAWEKLIYFSSFSLQRLYKFMTFIHLLYLFKVFQKRWNDFKS